MLHFKISILGSTQTTILAFEGGLRKLGPLTRSSGTFTELEEPPASSTGKHELMRYTPSPATYCSNDICPAPCPGGQLPAAFSPHSLSHPPPQSLLPRLTLCVNLCTAHTLWPSPAPAKMGHHYYSF